MAPAAPRYIVSLSGRSIKDWVNRILAVPGTELVRWRNAHVILRMEPDIAERLQKEFPELTIEEDSRHRMVSR